MAKKLNFQEQVLQQLSEEERIEFIFFYRKNCKRLGIAYLLLIFFGVFGLHKLYLNKRSAWLRLLFCWTGIPFLLAIVDLFLLPMQVRKYNRTLAVSLFDLIKKLEAVPGKLLLIDNKLSTPKTKPLEWIIAFALILVIVFPGIIYSSLCLTAHQLEIHYKTNHSNSMQNDKLWVL